MSSLLFEELPVVNTYDKKSIETAKKKFKFYKEQHVIIQGNFEDDIWQLTDEYSRIRIRFHLNQLSYKRYYQKVFQLSFEEFNTFLKSYIVLTLGQLVLNSVKEIVLDISHIISCPISKIEINNIFIKKGNRVLEFFTILPEPNNNAHLMDDLIDVIERLTDVQISDRSQRQLASFESYFKFHDIISDFWKNETNKDILLFYAPLYFWWQITAILPLRPREFLLTPKECLTKKEDGYYLTIRRTQLKGSGTKSVFYDIDKDYKDFQYKIPDRLANDLLEYMNDTAIYDSTELNTLFVSDPHYRHWKHKKHENSRYFTYINMSCVLRYFYHEIIKDRYGYQILSSEQKNSRYLEENEIEYIYLGDTRHIAMINILAEGGNIVTAMLLADHNNIMMSSHYATNISSLIECKTYRQYKKYLGQNETYELSHFNSIPEFNDDYILFDNGDRCFSPRFLHGSIDDCVLV